MSRTQEPSRPVDSLVDWRGNRYVAGDLIVYARMSGRCVEVQEGVVVRIYERHQEWGREEWQLRVEVQPTGRGSRDFHRTDSVHEWLDADGNVVEFEDAARGENGFRLFRKTAVTPKPVTLTITENVTVIPHRRNVDGV